MNLRDHFPSALLILASSICAPAVSAQNPAPAAAEQAKIHASGSGHVERAPDYVDVVIGIEAQENSANTAQEKAQSTMKAAIEALRKLSLADEELKSGTVDLSPRYAGAAPGRVQAEDPNKIVGYTATMTLRVRTSDLKSPARVIDAALSAGANRVGSVSFGIKEAIEAREEAITLATKAAKRKAEVMANALEVKLGRVLDASATDSRPWESANRFGNVAKMSQEGGADGDAVVPGKIEIWADVSLTFAIAE
jgi:uncharacterized protein